MAVLPEYQRRGIGSCLVVEALRVCELEGVDLVIVLGHPDYYPRFGFEAASPHGIESEFGDVGDAFMVKELKAGALQHVSGLISYRPEFSELC